MNQHVGDISCAWIRLYILDHSHIRFDRINFVESPLACYCMFTSTHNSLPLVYTAYTYPMVVLATLGLMLSGFHYSATYYAVEIAHMSYIQYLLLIAVIAAIVARITCYTHNNWKKELSDLVRSNTGTLEQYADAAFFVAIMIAFGVACHRVVQRHYYLSGLFVSIVIHALVNGAASCDTF